MTPAFAAVRKARRLTTDFSNQLDLSGGIVSDAPR
jgi:hypothetical protein